LKGAIQNVLYNEKMWRDIAETLFQKEIYFAQRTFPDEDNNHQSISYGLDVWEGFACDGSIRMLSPHCHFASSQENTSLENR